ncbi:MAG: hypothetical protein JXK04_01065 [Campylobacterales bacterium]|nr:hypothetical protein [Campylobacterales bacterium]
MRSRNGNRPILLPAIALISTLVFGADHYYIGYRLTTKNTQPLHETFTVAKAMQPCPGSPDSELTLERTGSEPLKRVLEREKTAFLDFAMSEAMRIQSDLALLGSVPRTLDTLTLPTRCYAVEFNDRFVTISPLK